MSNSKPITAAIQYAVRKNARSTEEAVAGYSKLSSSDQVKLLGLLEKARTLGEGMQQVDVPVEKKKTNRRQSAVINLVNKIKDALIQYNREDETTHDIKVDVAFIIGSLKTDFVKADDAEARNTLKRYDQEGNKNNFIGLLICYAKGKLLLEFKAKHTTNFKKNLREMLDYPYETARRYIEFARVVATYNRLLASGQSYTELSAYLKDIESHAESNSEFGALLKLPLRDIKCGNEDISLDNLSASLKKMAISSLGKNKKSRVDGESISATPRASVVAATTAVATNQPAPAMEAESEDIEEEDEEETN